MVTPTSGRAVNLYYISLSADYTNTTSVVATVKTGTTERYKVCLAPGAIYGRNVGAGKFYVAGAIDETLVLNLSAAQTVYYSVEYIEG